MVNIKQFLSGYWNNPDPRTREMNHNIAYSMILKVVGMIISILTIPITLHYLDQYEYGVWLTIFSILTWINYFDIGLGNGLRNKLAESIGLGDSKLGREYVSSTFALLSMISLAACVIFLSVSAILDWHSLLNIDYEVRSLRMVINVVAVCLFINFSLRTIGIVHLSYQKTWINDLLTVLGTFISLIWILGLRFFAERNLMNVALAFSIPPLLVYLLAIPVTFGKCYPDIKPDRKSIKKGHFKSLGSLGIRFFILQIACVIIYSTSNLIISRMFSPAEVTPYGIAYRYYNVLPIIFNIVVAPMWTAITDAYTRKQYNWITHNMRKMAGIWLLFCIGGVIMTVFSRFIYRIWVGPEVEIPLLLSISICLFNCCYMLSMVVSTYCNGTGHLNSALWSMSGAALVFVPLAVYMGHVMGPSGIALAMSIVLVCPITAMALRYFRDVKKEMK